MVRRAWTTVEIAALKRLSPTQSQDEVARALRRSKASVSNQAIRFGVAFQKHGKDHPRALRGPHVERAIELRSEGEWTPAEISQVTGLSPDQIYKLCRKKSAA